MKIPDYEYSKDYAFIREMQGSGLSIARAMGLPSSTVFHLEKGDVTPNLSTLESLYSYIYESGYRLNQSKEEIFREQGRELILFHGSKWGLKKVAEDGSRQNCDLGSGLYLGESYHAAASFVYEIPSSSVYAFSADLTGLNVVELNCDLTWMLLVCLFRGNLGQYQNHPLVLEAVAKIKEADVIIAPIADNRMYYVMGLFAKGEITDEQALHCLAASRLGKQYVFKTQKGLNALRCLERFYLCLNERNDFAKEGVEHTKYIETKLSLAKREYRGKGRFIDEIL
ncbi:MAG: DUF3990 domain-containing protein [Bacilli bacterium]|nr:DUF3990 domain-containing protein [Bacilli bacterium]